MQQLHIVEHVGRLTMVGVGDDAAGRLHAKWETKEESVEAIVPPCSERTT